MVTAFVLTGHGSLAAHHVGMLQALSHRGITPDLLIGTSAGAPNAAFIAGYGTGPAALRRLAAIWAGLGRRDMFPELVRGGAGSPDRTARPRSPAPLYRLLRSQLPYVQLQDARILVHLLARDARTGAAVFLSNGLAASAVVASCAMPGLLPAVQRRGRSLCDGTPVTGRAIAHAIGLGAQRIFLLSAGTSTSQPHGHLPAVAGPWMVRRPAVLGTDERVAVPVHVVPAPICGVTFTDYRRAPTLIHAARQTATAWLGGGGLSRSGNPAEHWPAAAAGPDLLGTRSA